MVFTDNFNRADENLEASADWTRVGGIAGGCVVSSNKVEGVDTGTVGSAYQCPDQGSADHYTETTTGNNGSGISCCVRLTDGNNFYGSRRTNIDLVQLFKRDGGTFTTYANINVPSSGFPVLRVEAEGNDIRFYVNGILRHTATDSFNNTETRQGIIGRGSAQTTLCDDFEADTIAGSGGADVLAQSLHGIEQGNPGLSRAVHTIEEGFVA